MVGRRVLKASLLKDTFAVIAHRNRTSSLVLVERVGQTDLPIGKRLTEVKARSDVIGALAGFAFAFDQIGSACKMRIAFECFNVLVELFLFPSPFFACCFQEIVHGSRWRSLWTK